VRETDYDAWIIAIHEGGHAVFDLQAGAGVVEVWSDGRQGHCRARGPTSAAGCLAGYVAEWRLTRPGDLPTAADFRDGAHLSDIRMAAARLGTDNPDRLRAAWVEAAEVLGAHWPAVERVAFALWKRGRLSGAEAEAQWRARRITA
jgi:hypothetical protein